MGVSDSVTSYIVLDIAITPERDVRRKSFDCAAGMLRLCIVLVPSRIQILVLTSFFPAMKLKVPTAKAPFAQTSATSMIRMETLCLTRMTSVVETPTVRQLWITTTETRRPTGVVEATILTLPSRRTMISALDPTEGHNGAILSAQKLVLILSCTSLLDLPCFR